MPYSARYNKNSRNNYDLVHKYRSIYRDVSIYGDLQHVLTVKGLVSMLDSSESKKICVVGK
jgi:hypothetical protein